MGHLLPDAEPSGQPIEGRNAGSPRARRRRDDRGAVIIEAAVVAPVFFLFLFAILEFGVAMRSYLALSNAVREGAREASVEAADSDADFSVVSIVNSAGAVIPDSRIERFVVYHASGPDQEPSAACQAGTPSSVAGQECNVYTAADFARPESEFGCDVLIPSPDRFWCPTGRETSRAAPPDWVGVWMQVRHPWVTGLFGPELTMTDHLVMRIEPRTS